MWTQGRAFQFLIAIFETSCKLLISHVFIDVGTILFIKWIFNFISLIATIDSFYGCKFNILVFLSIGETNCTIWHSIA